MNYAEALAYVGGLESRGWKLGLERVRSFVQATGGGDRLEGPSAPTYFHVAGTNGKGSTTAFLQSALVELGEVTGAFFSPYVVDPRERVQIGRALISEAEFAEVVTELAPIAEAMAGDELGPITEFEFKTAVGFATWARHRCTAVALEVGLGGNYDATNIIGTSYPIIVSIGLDHMHILGDTLGKIAFEKAGVIRSGRPVMIGEMPGEARDVIEAVARERGAEVVRYGREIVREGADVKTPFGTIRDLRPGLYGDRMEHNAALAASALLAAGYEDHLAIRRGIAVTTIPGRFQVEQLAGSAGEKTVVLDGGHNPDAARHFVRAFAERYPNRTAAVVTGMLQGHDPEAFFREVRPIAREFHLSPIDFFRARDPQTLAEYGAGIPTTVHPSVESALSSALESSAELVVVHGSNYLVGEVIRSETFRRAQRSAKPD
ncbi:MAG: cyanophycin synthetase [Fimbriimonadaceae bacterium]|nr:cyanophycin synthetase [Fimbriimonadaceae bacterium]